MRIARPRGSSILIGVLIFLFGLWLGWQANGFFAQDTCLDRGGAWDGDTRSCRFSKSPSAYVLPQLEKALAAEGHE